MTTDKTPSEVLAQLRHLYANLTNGGVRDTASAKRIAEGLLSPVIEALERGTPTAGEPVAWMRRDGMKAMPDDEKTGWIESGNAGIVEDYTRPLYAAPQAPQPERNPLTDEQCDEIYEALDSFGREVDHYEYGLPYCTSDGETLAKPVARDLIRQAAHGIKRASNADR